MKLFCDRHRLATGVAIRCVPTMPTSVPSEGTMNSIKLINFRFQFSSHLNANVRIRTAIL